MPSSPVPTGAPPAEGPVAAADAAQMRRVAFSSLLGTVVEYYDFLLYGTVAALVFGTAFFPQASVAAGTIAAFGTFAAGYVARPLGGIIFGHFGDRLGRKKMLVLTMVLMGAASALIGLLPDYRSIGIAAPVLLVLLRIVQGLAIGGEWGGATLMVVEHAAPGRRGAWSGVMQSGTSLGFLLSAGVVAAANSLLTQAQFMSWGWRIPFLFSVVLMAVGLYTRVKVTESPLFREAAAKAADAEPPRMPLLTVLKQPRTALLAAAVGLGPFALTGLITTYMLTYATGIGYSVSEVMNALLIISAIGLFTIPAFAALSDRLGRRRVVLGAAAVGLVAIKPVYDLVDSGTPGLLILGMSLIMVLQHAMYAPLAPMLSELFGTRVRYTGASLGYQMSALVGSGLVPLAASSLHASFPGSTPLVLLAGACILASLLAAWRLRETRGDAL
ncbi:MFS transporter [Streptomyces spiroverticillatus]|uniref:Putative proline/betaine transporter n=1 Tax=Streptomyces finlayi TaxID=67296 RepID=A0A918X3E9_9ACTN|nr:MFS transporter [Streptomyces finlayi]GHA27143.1 MFS transporter [Streptomyces spiroverticillatus]GHD08383.1 MFS transporter [Streptomyces finlayi]